MFLDPLLLFLQGTTIVFLWYNVCNRILKTKKKLRTKKCKNVSITEILTKRRVIELKKARGLYDFRNVWLQDHKI